ncbi:restriction endonuclease subunit S [Vibrio sp. 10N.222.54.C3]|uniref:restriction endonuclease subunit S n=1 Tax=unclassified Vibrio TaxID=2614977 RepID=UPI00354EB837
MTGRYKAYPEYKDSDVDWLKEVPCHWGAKSLKFMCSCNDEVINESTDANYEIEYVDIGSVSAVNGITKTEKVMFGKSPSRARRIVREGDVIVSTVRTYLEAIAPITNPPENMIVSTGFAVIRPKHLLDKGFASYCLRAKGFIKEVVARSVGVSYPAINASDLVEIKVPSLPQNEQQKIANFLDHETAKIDTLITKQEKLIELLKEKRQAIISHAVTKGLNPDAPMKDSGVEWLGEVPEHWNVMKFSYAIDFLEGPGILAVDFHDEGIPLLRIQNVKEAFVTDNFKTYLDPVKVKEKWDHFRVENGDLLISASASTGLISEVDKRTVGAIPYTGLIRLKPMTKDITTDFIRYIAQSDLFHEQIKLLQTGSTIQHFGPIHLQQMKVLLPPINEQNSIVEEIKQSISHIDILVENAGKIIDLTKERKIALISAAVTGKIDVR